MASVCREVVTVQLGHYANFVGTHWWNLQDASLCYETDATAPPTELQSDIIFREGLTPGGHVTYTPRLIAMDLKGSLQTLRQEGVLYESVNESSAFTWEGEVMIHKESPPAKNSFLHDLDKLDKGEILAEVDFSTSHLQTCTGGVSVASINSRLERVQKGYQLEGSVRVWSDFLRIHLHPRTIHVIHQYNHDGEAQRLEAFSQGEALCQGAVLEDLEDKLHFFVEECDYLQGFQVLCDLADGFSGLGSKVTELLQDSYGGRGILTWGLAPVNHPESSPVRDVMHVLNSALGMINMANHSSLFCPLTLRGGLGRCPSAPMSFPYLTYDPSLWYHSSAVLALVLDCLSVPYRLQHNTVPMGQMADALAVSGRKIVAAYGAVPFPFADGTTLPDALDICGQSLPWKPVSSCPTLEYGQCFGQMVTLRGVEGQDLISSLPLGVPPPSPWHSLSHGHNVLSSYLTTHYPASPLAVHLVSSPSKLTPPFPQIFHPSLDSKGFLQNRSRHHDTVCSVPVLSSLQSSPSVGRWLSHIHKAASALDSRRVTSSFFTYGLESGDVQEALEQLHTLYHCYVTPSSSEEEDDD